MHDGAPPFRDRRDAGRQLAAALRLFEHKHPVILALPRGGVPVAYEVAKALSAPLDILLVRKIGAPSNQEFGIGAVVDGLSHQTAIDRELMQRLHVPDTYIAQETKRQLDEIARRRILYRGDRTPIPLSGRTVIVVDDGIATGNTMMAALRSLTAQGVEEVAFAAPVGSRTSFERLRAEAAQGVCLACPPDFRAVGMYYADFDQTTDQEVIELLRAQDGTGT